MKDIKGEDIKFSYVKLDVNNYKYLQSFSCGNDSMDEDLHNKNNTLYNAQTTTFFAINQSNNDVICVYSLSCSGYVYTMHDKFYVYPAVEIKCFAVNTKYQDLKFSDDP